MLLVALGLAVLSGWAATRLSISTDLDGLFDARLPWKRSEAELDRLFPQNKDLLVAVIDAASPEQADATAEALARALRADPAHFRTVRRPDESPYLAREGLLFLDRPVLQSLLDRTIDAQPFLGQLAGDPSLRGLFAALALLGIGVERGQADLAPYEPALRAFHAALAAAAAGHPTPLSWESLLAGPVASMAGPYRFVLAQPVLDYAAVQPGGQATAVLRRAASETEFVRAGTARVRVTGSVALADEEFATAAQGAVAALAGSTALVVVWLTLAVRSWRVALPIVATLLVGLVLTFGLAAASVGRLNLISIAFAVLFVGIAVDFAIQFSVRFREALGEGSADLQGALADTARRAGLQILVAASATAAGFLAFVPTSFTGVAELGLIAGMGMLIAFACTLTVLPAGLALCRPRLTQPERGLALLRPLDGAVGRARWALLALAAVLAVMGAAATVRLRFNGDVLATKDPGTEAVGTVRDLMDSPLTNPYSAEVLAPDTAAADAVAARLRQLPLVTQVLTLSSFVPADQADKLAIVGDAANLLAPTLEPRGPAAPVNAADLRLATGTALAQLDKAVPKLPAGHALGAIADDLRALARLPDAGMMAANEALTRFLPRQLDRLRTALSAAPATAADVPAEIAREWRLPDGRVRVQATAGPGARDSPGLRAMVDQVRAVAPDAGGTAVAVTETVNTVVGAFRAAAGYALGAITLILAVALRRVGDVLLVLAPLLLSALLTVLCCAALPLELNFANIIALPLLLGVGVSFNIYFVMNWRAGQDRPLGSATARAVLFSALTTGTAFGSLALSHHPGTASMGVLLLLSLGCTLLVTLVFLPALLAAVPRT